MKRSFWGNVGINFKLKAIQEDTIVDAIRIAFNSDKYSFYSNSWYIDFRDRFRVFRFLDTPFIVKRTTYEKAEKEVFVSQKAASILNGKTVGSKSIEVIVPTKFSLSSDDDQNFLISEYRGPDMHEKVYLHMKPSISLEECLNVVNLLIENGITFIGFLPRNIVEGKDKIYLLDWETAQFSEQNQTGFDHLWRTNFLLNWSYLFSYKDLVLGLQNIDGIRKTLKEPPLVEYENTFKHIANINSSDHLLRNTIDKIVFGSELPLSNAYKSFYLRPNDMGHLVSDVFPREIDVLYDILSCTLRSFNELIFFYNLRLMTRFLVDYYKKVLIQKCSPELSLQYYLLIPILMMADEYISEYKYKDILLADDIYDLIEKISKTYKGGSITQFYIFENKRELSKLLVAKIRDKIANISAETKQGDNKEVENIMKYVLSICSKEVNQIYYERS